MDEPLHVILARAREDVSWACRLERVTVVQKGLDLPNTGREPSSYVWYILKHWDELEGSYLFLQANPLDHIDAKDLLEPRTGDFYWLPTHGRTGLVCDMNGQPHDRVDIKGFLDKIGIPYEKSSITFNGCCLFMVSAKRIKQRPREFYENLYEVLMGDNRSCYAFERCVGLIFG